MTLHSGPDQAEIFTIYDLEPGTDYRVRITAHNSAGSSVNTYRFSTLPTPGHPDTVRAGEAGELWGSLSSWSLVLVGSLGLVTVSTIVYLAHLTLSKLLAKKQPGQQQSNLTYDQYDQYHEMRQLEPGESLQATPAHTKYEGEGES